MQVAEGFLVHLLDVGVEGLAGNEGAASALDAGQQPSGDELVDAPSAKAEAVSNFRNVQKYAIACHSNLPVTRLRVASLHLKRIRFLKKR